MTSSTVCSHTRKVQDIRYSTPIRLREDRTLQQQLEIDLKQGFNRIEVNGEMKRIDEYTPVAGDEVYLLVDRMAVANSKDAISRLTDSAETAMYEGDGTCMLRFFLSDGTTKLHTFSTKFEADGIIFEEPNDQMFSFNSPIGACPAMRRIRQSNRHDEHLVVRIVHYRCMKELSYAGVAKRWVNGKKN